MPNSYNFHYLTTLKLSCLKTENETLKNEIKEQINNNEKIQHKNINLLQR